MILTDYHEWMRQLVANAQEKKYQYIISRLKNNAKFFYYDFDIVGRVTDPINPLYQLVWTPIQRQAFPFESEQEVEEFKAAYITPRKASIIRVIKSPHSLIDLM